MDVLKIPQAKSLLNSEDAHASKEWPPKVRREVNPALSGEDAVHRRRSPMETSERLGEEGLEMAASDAAQLALYEHLDLLSDILKHMSDPLAVVRQGPDGEYTYIFGNPSAEARIGGWQGLTGRSLHDVHSIHVLEQLIPLMRTVTQNSGRHVMDMDFEGWCGEVVVDPLPQRLAEHRYFLLTIRDISERKRYEKKLKKAAYRDPLTKLHNRRYLDRCLRLLRNSRATYGLFYIDCDNFKFINDRYGHDAGDAFLVQFSERLRGAVRQRDVVVRHGGDEFIVLCRIHGLEECNLVGQRLVRALSGQYTIAGQTIEGAVSVGAACYPVQVESLEDLILAANEAMHQSKHERKGQLTVYRFVSPKLESLLKR
ncbi:diguanylate cyclase (GGDEF) domain-containing protein [Alicyclobacillus tolerans]|uniref:Diguanylate cyclase (GGDEF) domain-containing protein n=1 Tax=Alicyclobacillus tolerans TaxID=90970 RepID=A0A1M6N093_9BACL|nr:diguanylate cyclase (GGDEF) domain-containing protein [Alicyclobacillus montanus]